MRVTVVEQSAAECRRIAEALSKRGFDVATPPAGGAVELLRGEPPDVLFVDVRLGERQLGLVRDLRLACPPGQTWLVAIHGGDPAVIERAFQAGVDDVVRRGACGEELAGRASTPSRIQAWVAKLSAGFVRGPIDVRAVPAWRDAPQILGDAARDMLGVDLARTGWPDGPLSNVAEVSLPLPAESLEVRLAIGLGMGAAEPFAEALLGGPVEPAALDDTMREVANVLAGVFKRVAMASGLAFSIGLPASVPAPVAWEGSLRWGLATGRTHLGLQLSWRHAAPRWVAAHQLTPGMVLAGDLHDQLGRLLLASGASLTETTIARIVDLLGGDLVIAVGDPSLA